MSAMSPIVLQDDISATSAVLPSEEHYTSANEILKGQGMAAGTVTFREPNLKVQGPLSPPLGIITSYEPNLELQMPVAPPPGTVKCQEPNLKVQGPLASPQIGALSNDVLQSQEQSGTSLTTTPSAVNLTTTGPMTQAVQGADVAHQTGIFLANSCHASFQYSALKLSLLPRAGATSPASSRSGTEAHTLCVNKLRQYWCVCYSPGRTSHILLVLLIRRERLGQYILSF